MSIVPIQAGLRIFDREIDLEIDYDPGCMWSDIHEVNGERYIGKLNVTEKIRSALEAAAKYQAEIGE